MKTTIKFIAVVLAFAILVASSLFALVGCNKADNVQENIRKASDHFETYREVTFINLRTDKVLLQVEGYISIKDSSTDEIAIIIQTAPNEYKMHYLYIGGEVVYLVEQKEDTHTDPYHWDIRVFAEFPRIIFD